MLPDKVLEALRAAAPSAGPREERADGWSNFLTGLGTSRDKRNGGQFDVCPVTDPEARALWEGDDLAAHAIETYPDEMLRAGYDVCVTPADDGDGDAARDLGRDMGRALEAINADEAFRTALCYERAYGGSAIWPIMNDGVGDFSKPLNESGITKIDRLVVFEPAELITELVYTDPTRADYGMPAVFRLQPLIIGGAEVTQGTRIHESRLITFPGIRVSRAQQASRTGRYGWGGSVLTRINTVLRDFNLGFDGASHLLHDFSQAVMSVRGLKEALASPNGVEIMRRKMQVMDMSRSLLRMLLVDAGSAGEAPETFTRVATPMAGMPETLDRLIDRLAAALEEPASRFMKQAPGGLNPGDTETKWWEQKVHQKQDKHLRPRANKLVRFLFLSKAGPSQGVVPPSWKIDFRALSTPTEAETATTRKTIAETDEIYMNRGVLSPLDVVKSRFGPDGFSSEMNVDVAEVEKMMNAAPEPAKPIVAAGAAPGDTANRAG